MNSDEIMKLAARIAKHQAPAQVRVDPDAARRELVRLSVEKLLDETAEPDFWILDIWECAMLRRMGIKPDF
jgi:hypothetical protein